MIERWIEADAYSGRRVIVPPWSRGSRRALLYVLVVAVGLVGGCGFFAGGGGGSGEDPFNQLDHVRRGSGCSGRSRRAMPPRVTPRTTTPTPRPPAKTYKPEDKIHRTLLALIASNPADQVEVIITFRDTLEIPQLPEDDRKIAPVGVGGSRSALQGAIDSLKAKRAVEYASVKADTTFVGSNARLLHGFWLLRAAHADVRADRLLRLAAWSEVVYIQPRFTKQPPPGNVLPDNANNEQKDDPIEARTQIGSDPYVDAGYGGGKLALLDTGVYYDHLMLKEADLSGFDCVDGGVSCTGAGKEDCTGDEGHGTASAALLVGTSSPYQRYGGLTNARLDCIQVYGPGDCPKEFDAAAGLRGIEKALDRGDRVIVVEVQDDVPAHTGISKKAAQAFKSGAVVIAAAGDYPVEDDVRGPANSSLVFAVGARHVRTGDRVNQSYRKNGVGEPFDGWPFKPEILAPSYCETASALGDGAVNPLTETSGAAPIAGGAALLLRNWMKGSASSIDPGKVYAMLVLCGQKPSSDFRAADGAGMIEMPGDGDFWWEKIEAKSGHDNDIELDLAGTNAGWLEVALWWPVPSIVDASGYPGDAYSNINLELVAPDGQVVASGTQQNGVFERARGKITASRRGTWTVRIVGEDIPSGKQIVYMAAYAH